MLINHFFREFRFNLRLAAPVGFGQAANVFVGLVDTFMLARVGETAVAAAALGNAVFLIIFLAGVNISTGMTPLVAYADGEKDDESIRSILRNGLWMNLALGVLFGAIIYGASLLLDSPFLGQDPEVAAQAIPYLQILSLTVVPIMFFQTFKQFADGLAYTWPGMVATLIANVINIAGNYAFIYGKWGAPALGVAGAGLGTLLSRFGMVAVILIVMQSKEVFRKYVRTGYFKNLSWKWTKKILGLGIPSGLQALFEHGVFGVATILAGRFGATQQAAHQIVVQMCGFAYTFVSGFGVASTVRAGYYYGLNQFKRIKIVTGSLLLMVIATMAFFGLFYVVGREWLPALFIDSEDIVRIAAPLFVVAAGFEIFDGVQVTALGALRGLQDVKIPTWITFVGYWVVAFPMSLFFGMVLGLETVGIWLGLASGLIVAAFALTFRFYRMINRSIRESKNLSTFKGGVR